MMNHRHLVLRLIAALCAVALAALAAGCPAVYPELPTRMRKVLAEQALDPPPPSDMVWLKFESARIPERTRGGKTWDEAFGKKPDPHAKLFINGKEVLKTEPQANTLEPTWPNSPRGNFRIEEGDKLRIELWDSNAVNDKPIAVRDVGHPGDDARMSRKIRVEFDVGGEIVLAYEPARAMLGLGLWYELRTEACFITRMLEGSPAERAGLLPGDEVIKLGTKDVKTMSPDEVRTAFNGVPSTGLPLTVKHADGTILSVTVKEGAIYPPYDQYPNLD
jgi:hypothetical protein